MEIKDKPNSMSVREWITKKIATGIMIPEKTVKAVMNHQFDTAYESLKKYDSIEISGFGKFYYNRKKADTEIEKILRQKAAFEEIINSSDATEKKRQSNRLKLEKLDQKLEKILEKHGKTE